ncbi:hypothetical protein HC931_16545 [Candidatus Gracilibacteria bacterium]|jgi:hypothetical protein|nr:hypothetical protein [Candidatus Gracilibacteria bacterium]NJM87940.1 hypothetical protein [Hydrococcus sp. RU_2_2]NJP21183.1 hypothetical protein [Hydrococcus sp. CRU_1_1]NJQ97128.1 hypothetical protein [Hydrococcus sp. CSU_1_8]
MYPISYQNSTSIVSVAVTVDVSRIDRWHIYHRLQELTIPCWCLEDGSLRVEVNDSIAAILVRSVVHQIVASRPDLLKWLESCWQI